MALLAMFGFDNMETADIPKIPWEWGITGATPKVSSGGAFGGGCLAISEDGGSGGSGWVRIPLPSDVSNLSVGFWFHVVNSGEGTVARAYDELHRDNWELYISTDQHLVFKRGHGGTDIGSTTSSLAMDAWHWIEVRCETSNSPGSNSVVAVQGTTEINIAAGVDTQDTGSNTTRYVTIGTRDVSDDHLGDYDDIIFMDTDGELSGGFTNPPFIETIRPNAAGATTTWSSTEITAWSAMASAFSGGDGYDSAAYIEASAKDMAVTFALSSLSSVSSLSVFAVQFHAQIEKDVAKTKAVDIVLLPSGASADLICGFCTTSYLPYRVIFSANPVDSVSWAVSEIDAMSTGLTVGQ